MELLYFIPLFLMIVSIAAHRVGRLSTWNLIMSAVLAFVVAWYINPYAQYVIIPIRNVVWLGMRANWLFYAAVFHVASLFAMGFVAFLNLLSTHGTRLWR